MSFPIHVESRRVDLPFSLLVVGLSRLRYLGIDPITDGDLMWIADEVRMFDPGTLGISGMISTCGGPARSEWKETDSTDDGMLCQFYLIMSTLYVMLFISYVMNLICRLLFYL